MIPGDVRITHVTETKFISEEDNSVDLWAKANDNSRLRTIWVEVKPPDYMPTGSGGSGQVEMILSKTPTTDYNNQTEHSRLFRAWCLSDFLFCKG
ncbi:MAG: hypothetical protein GY749_06125 [Desulfobacteraceae bacterium]|nr:hypothetical protein [Desulfobacteraceae bacterium]